MRRLSDITADAGQHALLVLMTIFVLVPLATLCLLLSPFADHREWDL